MFVVRCGTATTVRRAPSIANISRTSPSASSSAISSIGYDPDASVLEVEFSSGAVYDYYGVPPKVFRALKLFWITGDAI